MNERFVVGVYASLATGNLRPRLGEYHRRFPDVDAQTVIVGRTPSRPIWLVARST
jgi:DNA-binding transcriptional LysR family regulator